MTADPPITSLLETLDLLSNRTLRSNESKLSRPQSRAPSSTGTVDDTKIHVGKAAVDVDLDATYVAADLTTHSILRASEEWAKVSPVLKDIVNRILKQTSRIQKSQAQWEERIQKRLDTLPNSNHDISIQKEEGDGPVKDASGNELQKSILQRLGALEEQNRHLVQELDHLRNTKGFKPREQALSKPSTKTSESSLENDVFSRLATLETALVTVRQKSDISDTLHKFKQELREEPELVSREREVLKSKIDLVDAKTNELSDKFSRALEDVHRADSAPALSALPAVRSQDFDHWRKKLENRMILQEETTLGLCELKDAQASELEAWKRLIDDRLKIQEDATMDLYQVMDATAQGAKDSDQTALSSSRSDQTLTEIKLTVNDLAMQQKQVASQIDDAKATVLETARSEISSRITEAFKELQTVTPSNQDSLQHTVSFRDRARFLTSIDDVKKELQSTMVRFDGVQKELAQLRESSSQQSIVDSLTRSLENLRSRVDDLASGLSEEKTTDNLKSRIHAIIAADPVVPDFEARVRAIASTATTEMEERICRNILSDIPHQVERLVQAGKTAVGAESLKEVSGIIPTTELGLIKDTEDRFNWLLQRTESRILDTVGKSVDERVDGITQRFETDLQYVKDHAIMDTASLPKLMVEAQEGGMSNTSGVSMIDLARVSQGVQKVNDRLQVLEQDLLQHKQSVQATVASEPEARLFNKEDASQMVRDKCIESTDDIISSMKRQFVTAEQLSETARQWREHFKAAEQAMTTAVSNVQSEADQEVASLLQHFKRMGLETTSTSQAGFSGGAPMPSGDKGPVYHPRVHFGGLPHSALCSSDRHISRQPSNVILEDHIPELESRMLVCENRIESIQVGVNECLPLKTRYADLVSRINILDSHLRPLQDSQHSGSSMRDTSPVTQEQGRSLVDEVSILSKVESMIRLDLNSLRMEVGRKVDAERFRDELASFMNKQDVKAYMRKHLKPYLMEIDRSGQWSTTIESVQRSLESLDARVRRLTAEQPITGHPKAGVKRDEMDVDFGDREHATPTPPAALATSESALCERVTDRLAPELQATMNSRLLTELDGIQQAIENSRETLRQEMVGHLDEVVATALLSPEVQEQICSKVRLSAGTGKDEVCPDVLWRERSESVIREAKSTVEKLLSPMRLEMAELKGTVLASKVPNDAPSLQIASSFGLWIWKSGMLRLGTAVPWNHETANTNAHLFRWDPDQPSIRIAQPGLYQVSFAFFTNTRPCVQLVVNGDSVLSATHSTIQHHREQRLTATSPAGRTVERRNRLRPNVSGISMVEFLALPGRSTVCVHYHGKVDRSHAEGFLCLQQLPASTMV